MSLCRRVCAARSSLVFTRCMGGSVQCIFTCGILLDFLCCFFSFSRTIALYFERNNQVSGLNICPCNILFPKKKASALRMERETHTCIYNSASPKHPKTKNNN